MHGDHAFFRHGKTRLHRATLVNMVEERATLAPFLHCCHHANTDRLQLTFPHKPDSRVLVSTRVRRKRTGTRYDLHSAATCCCHPSSPPPSRPSPPLRVPSVTVFATATD